MASALAIRQTMVFVVLAACGTAASAGVQAFDAFTRGLAAGSGAPDIGPGGIDLTSTGRHDGVGPRGGGSPSVADNDTAGIQLLMYGSNGTVRTINTLGNLSVRRGPTPTALGANVNGELIGGSRGTILASWDEYLGSQFNTINVVISTSDSQDILPIGVVNPADPTETFDFWTWNFGVGDPVTWRAGASRAPLFAASYKLSSDGGQTFFSSKAITNLGDPWNGVDVGTTQSEPGSGVNYILLSYKVGPVPTPGTLALAGLCTLGAARRRRR